MRTVSRFESNLLRILHCFLGHSHVNQVLPALVRPEKRPRCLSRDAVDLVQQSLAVGTTMLLVRGGAWTQQRHLRDGQIREGSLWQRTDPADLAFDFSPASLDLMIWLTQSDATREMPVWVPPKNQPLTLGDQFLVMLAARAMRETTLVSHWYKTTLFRENALIALMFPNQFAEAKVLPEPQYEPWLQHADGWVIEAIQDELVQLWTELELHKCRITRVEDMQRLGRAEQTILEALFDAAEHHGRRDLCRFVLEVMSRIATPQSQRGQWIASLDTTRLRIADRTEAYQCASAFLRVGPRMRQWQSASQAVGYFDEGYGESQLWKTLWETSRADESLGHADRVLQEFSF